MGKTLFYKVSSSITECIKWEYAMNNPLSPSLSSKPSSNRNKEIRKEDDFKDLMIYIAISIGRSTSLSYSS